MMSFRIMFVDLSNTVGNIHWCTDKNTNVWVRSRMTYEGVTRIANIRGWISTCVACTGFGLGWTDRRVDQQEYLSRLWAEIYADSLRVNSNSRAGQATVRVRKGHSTKPRCEHYTQEFGVLKTLSNRRVFLNPTPPITTFRFCNFIDWRLSRPWWLWPHSRPLKEGASFSTGRLKLQEAPKTRLRLSGR